MNQTTQNILGGIVVVFIIGVVSFAHKANQNATEAKVVCYNTINNVGSGVSEARLVKMLNTCNK